MRKGDPSAPPRRARGTGGATRLSRRRLVARGSGLALSAVLVACAPPAEQHARPLIDGYHAPDVLTENGVVAFPATAQPNRFLTGWWPLGRRSLALAPIASPTRIELVNLASRRRELRLRSVITVMEPGAAISVAVGERDPFEVPLGPNVRIPLPELPIGRVTVDLDFPEGAQLAVKRGRLPNSLTAGEIRFDTGNEILQSPTSAIDFVQLVPAGAVLHGDFVPPRDTASAGRFRLLAESEDGPPVTLFDWPGSSVTEGIEAPLGAKERILRLRLLASGEGGPGRWRDLRLTWAEAEPEVVPPPAAPRVVVMYVFDALRADATGYAGADDSITPELDRRAAEGVVLRRHISVAPNTKPSLKSLFTGQAFLLEGHRKLPDELPTLAERFLDAGYLSVAFAGTPWISTGFGTGRGFMYRPREAVYKIGPSNTNAATVHALALDWLQTMKAEHRAFVYMHTMHPHNPYDPPEPFKSRFVEGNESSLEGSTKELRRIRSGSLETGPEDRERLRALYAAGLAYNDAELARFLEQLGELFEPGEVLIIFTADHGEELFDHGGVLHGYTLFEEQLRVPLVFWWPGRLEPTTIDAGTDHLDLHATLLDLIGQVDEHQEGRSLWPLVTGASADVKPVRFAAASGVKGGIFMAASERYKLIWAPRLRGQWGMGQGNGRSYEQEYVFDLGEDPGETRNLAGERILEVDWLRSRLMAWIERGRIRESSPGEVEQIDDDTRRRLEALGYLD